MDDFEAVVNINENVLRGRDYVPSTYHSMLTDPNISAYVGEVENRIVRMECKDFNENSSCTSILPRLSFAPNIACGSTDLQ